MNRGFAYSLSALALALAVVQAILAQQSGYADLQFSHASFWQKKALESASFSEGRAGFESALLESGALAAKAAFDFENSSGPLVNSSCVLYCLALRGNATPADCPGENFTMLEISNASFALSNWLLGARSRPYGITAVNDSIASLAASKNSTHAKFEATLYVNASVAGANASLNRAYDSTAAIRLPG